jgi:hypothetical protein
MGRVENTKKTPMIKERVNGGFRFKRASERRKNSLIY